MIKKYTFNKRKNNAIILLHGLYTNAGFWLAYLNLFKDFRLISYDIDYSLLLKTQSSKNYLQEFLNECREEENISAVISHSFGTVVSDLAFENKHYSVFKICPVAFSKRLDSQGFMLEIENKSAHSRECIYEYMNLVSEFTSKFRDKLNHNGSLYIPNQDGFFSYEVPEYKKNEFNGDHFNIGLALSGIVAQLTNQ